MAKHLQFTEEEKPPEKTPTAPPTKKKPPKHIDKLEQKSARHHERLTDAQAALPKKKVITRKLVYDEQKRKVAADGSASVKGAGKVKSKLRFEPETIPIGEAKWNQPKKRGIPQQAVGSIRTMAVNKAHAKVYQVEHENVGTKAAHRGELMGESAYRSTKRGAQKAYRHHKNRPYRKVSKLEAKTIKVDGKLNHRKAMQTGKPKFKSNPLSRMAQKRTIKRNYAAAKKSGQVAKKSAGMTAKLSKLATAIVRKNPKVWLVVGLAGLIVLLVMAIVSMSVVLFSGGGGFLGSLFYVADYADIDDASTLWTELEVDLRIYLYGLEGEFDLSAINHDPFELMAFLTAMYGEFQFSEVEASLRALFDEKYQLIDGTLHVTPLADLLYVRMSEEQWRHFNILLLSRGMRQFVGSPFDFDWLPYVSSGYGWRVHPISGERSFHTGIDIALPTGTEILAGFDGTVTRVAYDADGYGNVVVIDNGNGVQALYAHCYVVFVSEGQRVSAGDVIATVGSTGNSTGPHLHMEVIRNGRRLNPIFFTSIA